MDAPDVHIEHFWLSFKQSMYNFYEHHAKPFSSTEISSFLNLLQRECKYNEIEQTIRDHITTYALDIIRQNDTYHAHILATNIKRWNEISSSVFHINVPTYYNRVYMLFDLYYKNPELHLLFGEVENIDTFVQYAIEHKKSNILDKIRIFEPLSPILFRLYGVRINEKASSAKLIKLIFPLINVQTKSGLV